MAEQSKVAVAGATGRLGRPLVEVLEQGGHEVVAMSRATGVDGSVSVSFVAIAYSRKVIPRTTPSRD